MARLVGIVLAVLAIWTSVEIYSHGTAGAFGGALAGWSGGDDEAPSSAAETLSSARRAGRAVERAHEQQQERYERLMDD